MSLVTGMSQLRLYENKACTRELAKDVDGNYILSVDVLSANTLSPHTIILWVKNVGDHKAYSSTVSLGSSTLPSTTITTTISNITMEVNEVRKVTVNCPITQGQTGTYSISLGVSYDSI